jgi:hypothetical protein
MMEIKRKDYKPKEVKDHGSLSKPFGYKVNRSKVLSDKTLRFNLDVELITNLDQINQVFKEAKKHAMGDINKVKFYRTNRTIPFIDRVNPKIQNSPMALPEKFGYQNLKSMEIEGFSR